jgi:ketopantoate reductase
MKIRVIGAGAIGGLLAAKLAHAGEDVSVIACGAHLASIVENGLSLLEEGQEIVAPVAALCSQTMFISLPPVAARTQQTHDFARGIGRLNK